MFRIFSASISFISHSTKHTSLKFYLYKPQAYLFNSLAQTISAPACSNALDKPPAPANKSPAVYLLFNTNPYLQTLSLGLIYKNINPRAKYTTLIYYVVLFYYQCILFSI